MLDWEVVHVGDPAFDIGTMGAHLILKALRQGPDVADEALLESVRCFWRSYSGPADLSRALRHTGAVMLARLHGKSPVEYLRDDSSRRRVQWIGERSLRGEFDGIEAMTSAASKARQEIP